MDFSNVSCKCSVTRKIHSSTRVIQALLYLCVFIFVIIGMHGSFLWLIPTLGTLFFAWYYMGEAKVTYDYELEGTQFKVIRISGMRSKTKIVEFLKLDMNDVIIISEENTSRLDEAEALTASAQPKRVTYFVNTQDPNKVCLVMYAKGSGADEGRYVKVYMNPSPEMLEHMRLMCPGRVFPYEN